MVKSLSFNSISNKFTLLRAINFNTAHDLSNLCTNFLHVSLKFLFIKTKLENLNLSTHIVIGNTLLIKTQTGFIRIHVGTEKSVFKTAGLILKKITSIRMPVVDTLMLSTKPGFFSLGGPKFTLLSLSKSLLCKKLIFLLNLRHLRIHYLSLHSKTKIIRKGTIINIRSRTGRGGSRHLRLNHIAGATDHKIRIISGLFKTSTLSKRSIILIVHIPEINLLLILFIHQHRLILVLLTSRHTTSKKITDSTDTAHSHIFQEIHNSNYSKPRFNMFRVAESNTDVCAS